MGWIRAVALDLDGTIASGDAVGRGHCGCGESRSVPGCSGGAGDRAHRGGAACAGFRAWWRHSTWWSRRTGQCWWLTGRQQLLAEPVPARLADRLQSCGVGVHRGQVLLDTGADRDTECSVRSPISVWTARCCGTGAG